MITSRRRTKYCNLVNELIAELCPSFPLIDLSNHPDGDNEHVEVTMKLMVHMHHLLTDFKENVPSPFSTHEDFLNAFLKFRVQDLHNTLQYLKDVVRNYELNMYVSSTSAKVRHDVYIREELIEIISFNKKIKLRGPEGHSITENELKEDVKTLLDNDFSEECLSRLNSRIFVHVLIFNNSGDLVVIVPVLKGFEGSTAAQKLKDNAESISSFVNGLEEFRSSFEANLSSYIWDSANSADYKAYLIELFNSIVVDFGYTSRMLSVGFEGHIGYEDADNPELLCFVEHPPTHSPDDLTEGYSTDSLFSSALQGYSTANFLLHIGLNVQLQVNDDTKYKNFRIDETPFHEYFKQLRQRD